MDNLCSFYRDHGVRYTSHEFTPSCKEVEVTRVIEQSGSGVDDIETTVLLDSEVMDWLAIAPKTLGSTQQKANGLRMVWIPLMKDSTPWRYQIRKESFELILRHFQLEMSLAYSSTAAIGCANFTAGSETNPVQCYAVFMSDLVVCAWSHETKTGKSQGVCLGDPWIIKTAQGVLQHQLTFMSHPVGLLYLIPIILGNLVDRDLLRDNQIIAEVENRTSHHGWKKTQASVAKGNYGTLSARMSGCATSLAGLDRIANFSQEILTFALNRSCEMQEDSQQDGTRFPQKSFLECGKVLDSRLKAQNVQLDFLKERTHIQLTALFNLIAQKDAKLNITLAKDSRTLASASKRDSSSMKTLAAVTVAFLPATFVASLFAMPLFNWDAGPGSSIVKGRFWIYWVVTAPLTMTTLVIWLSWTHRQSLIHRAQDRNDRNQLVDEIGGSEKGDGQD